MAKTSKKSLSPDESLVALDCQVHRWIGRDGVCTATDCLVRKGNVENHSGECRLYEKLAGSA